MNKKYSIPQISKEELQNRSHIKPVMSFKGVLHFIKECDLETVSYIWDAKKDKKAENLIPVQDITTLHTYGYYGMFKPSIAEVLRQIPSNLLKEIKAFEIINEPKNAIDLRDEQDALNAGYHVATTRLYKFS